MSLVFVISKKSPCSILQAITACNAKGSEGTDLQMVQMRFFKNQATGLSKKNEYAAVAEF